MLQAQLVQGSSTGQPAFWKEGKILKCVFNIVPTNVNSAGNANPYVAGGDTLDLTQIFAAASTAPGWILPTIDLPLRVVIVSQRPKGAANNGNLFQYEFAPGTTLQNGAMQVFTGAAAQTGLTELTAGNYPAGVLNDTIQAEAWFFMP